MVHRAYSDAYSVWKGYIMAIIEGWLPPSRENWKWIVFAFQLFPLVSLAQWAQILGVLPQWYSMGKTAQQSRFNIPGKLGWWSMETPGYLTLLYCLYALPKEHGIEQLPWANYVLAAMFTIHYIYRSIIYSILSPSISPYSPILWLGGICFNTINALSIGGWLGAYGPTTRADWVGQAPRIEVGMMIWAVGLMANIYHDDELREIRRAAARDCERRMKEKGDDGSKAGKKVEKVYKIPDNGLFRVILFPHYFTEWIEWIGFWMVGGLSFAPGRIFVANEISTMLPRALEGKEWYVQKFGEEKIGSKKAVIPGII